MTLIVGRQKPVPGEVLCIQNVPGAAGYRFEWIRNQKLLQFVRIGTKPERGQVLAQGIDNQDLAIALATVFGVGMAEARKIYLCDMPKFQPQPAGAINGQG